MSKKLSNWQLKVLTRMSDGWYLVLRGLSYNLMRENGLRDWSTVITEATYRALYKAEYIALYEGDNDDLYKAMTITDLGRAMVASLQPEPEAAPVFSERATTDRIAKLGRLAISIHNEPPTLRNQRILYWLRREIYHLKMQIFQHNPSAGRPHPDDAPKGFRYIDHASAANMTVSDPDLAEQGFKFTGAAIVRQTNQGAIFNTIKDVMEPTPQSDRNRAVTIHADTAQNLNAALNQLLDMLAESGIDHAPVIERTQELLRQGILNAESTPVDEDSALCPTCNGNGCEACNASGRVSYAFLAGYWQAVATSAQRALTAANQRVERLETQIAQLNSREHYRTVQNFNPPE